MFDRLKALLFKTDAEDEGKKRFNADEKTLAEAALMFHIVAVDGIVTKSEQKRLAEVLSREYELSAGEVADLIREARAADREAIDLYSFTRTLRQSLDYEERLSLIANLWEMVFADGEVNEFEDNIVWRVAELLDVETRDRMELKQSVARKRDSVS